VNKNKYAILFGDCGFDFFDIYRKLYLGIASHFTIFAFVLSIWGCLALTTSTSVVQRSYWVGTTGNSTIGSFSMYVGLRSLEYVNCDFVPGWQSYPGNCVRQTIKWTDSACQAGPAAAACQACDNIATAMWTTAFFSCTGLIMSWLGTQTRMRIIADCPVQKLLGVFSELMGTFSLAYALFTFERGCFANLRSALNGPGTSARFYTGPGMICFAICCASGFVRVVCHSIVPLPRAKNNPEMTNKGLEGEGEGPGGIALQPGAPPPIMNEPLDSGSQIRHDIEIAIPGGEENIPGPIMVDAPAPSAENMPGPIMVDAPAPPGASAVAAVETAHWDKMP
jgi:hypothetical protein